jgi:hypothetical protein
MNMKLIKEKDCHLVFNKARVSLAHVHVGHLVLEG